MGEFQLQNYKKKAAQGAVLMSFKRVYLQIIFTGSNIFLARLLFPEDFGLFAVVTFVMTFANILSDFGLAQALIQKRREITSRDLQTVFTSQLILSILVILLVYVVSPMVSNAYDFGQKGVDVFRLYSLYLLFTPFKTISYILLERELQYKKLILVEVTEITIGSITTVAGAYFGLGVFSFPIGSIFGHITGAVLYFTISPWKIRLKIFWNNLVSLSRFGFSYEVNVILALFYGPLIMLYLGRKVGAENLGYYQFAASLSVVPLAAAEIINRIAFPLGSRVQKDKKVLSKLVEKVISTASSTTIVSALFMLVVSEDLVRIFYSDKWLPSLPSLRISLVQMVFVAYVTGFSQLVLSLGHSKIVRNMSIFWTILTWFAAPILIHKFNYIGMNLTNLLISVSGMWLFFKLRRIVEFNFSSNFFPFVAIALISSSVVFIFLQFGHQTFLRLLAAGLLGGITYITLLFLIKREEVKENLNLLKGLLTKRD